MIECLSNPSWINPQIDFLLFLQNLRVGHFEIFDKFFLSITVFGEFWLPTLVCAIVYWCFDSKAGLYLFSLLGINSMLTHFFKMIACVYRPWVLSDKIHPSELAVPFAKGYSFPSGHSSMSSAVLGGLAYVLRHKIIFCLLLVCTVLLVGFSRLWLGVHTPQDVIVGLTIGFSLVFIINKIINWAEKNPNRYLWLALWANIAIIFIVVYIRYFNNYRIDYVSGEMLVNPKHAIHSTTAIYGYILGILNGSFLCRRFFPFSPQKTTLKNRVIIGLIGVIFVIILLKFAVEKAFMSDIPLRYIFPTLFVVGLFITLIYPIIFRFLDKNTAESRKHS